MWRAGGLGVALWLAAGGMAPAAENFIPQGHSYSTENDQLPPLNSEEDQIDLGADLLESEIYVEQRERKRFESEFNRFIYEQEPDVSDDMPDF